MRSNFALGGMADNEEETMAATLTVNEFCDRNHIRKLSLFDSVLTERFRPESDVDMLVELNPGAHITCCRRATDQLAALVSWNCYGTPDRKSCAEGGVPASESAPHRANRAAVGSHDPRRGVAADSEGPL
jgi:predicted nucleotidyltransferase